MREIDKEYAFEDGYNAAANESKGGDLISREALKEVLKECAYSYDGVNTWIMKDEVLGIIDNAPTVEPDKIQAIMSDYLVYRCEPQRPQGEWVKVKEERMSIEMSGEIVTRYKCSKCGRLILTIPSNLVNYPFCHCGADMRG